MLAHIHQGEEAILRRRPAPFRLPGDKSKSCSNGRKETSDPPTAIGTESGPQRNMRQRISSCGEPFGPSNSSARAIGSLTGDAEDGDGSTIAFGSAAAGTIWVTMRS